MRNFWRIGKSFYHDGTHNHRQVKKNKVIPDVVKKERKIRSKECAVLNVHEII